jgi:hypothetical protein
MDARYEFRYFEEDLLSFKEKLANLADDEIERQSEELYIVSPDIDEFNYKIRYDQIDIKKLIKVVDVFEQWFPEFKTGFPVAATLLEERILPLMKISPVLIKKQSYKLDEFIEEIVLRQPGMTIANVVKKRYGYIVNDCITEFAEVSINKRQVHTVAIESIDIEKAKQTMESIELKNLPNINYVKAIKRYMDNGEGD